MKFVGDQVCEHLLSDANSLVSGNNTWSAKVNDIVSDSIWTAIQIRVAFRLETLWPEVQRYYFENDEDK